MAANPITVSGALIDLIGRPVPGVGVRVGDSVALSNADGTFTLADVEPPYTIAVVDGSEVTEYEDLTTPSPRLQLVKYPETTHTATIQGNLRTASGPLLLPLGYAGNITYSSAFDSNDEFWSIGSGNFGINQPLVYSTQAQWVGDDESDSGTIAALVAQPLTSPRSAFFYFGSTGITVAEGGTFNADLVLQPIATTSVQGDVALSPGMQGSLIAQLQTGDADVYANSASTTAGAFSLPLPNVPGASASLVLNAYDGASSESVFVQNLPLDATGINLASPATPTKEVLPEDGHIMDATDSFMWQGPPERVFLFEIFCETGIYRRYTTEDSIPLARIQDALQGCDGGSEAFWELSSFGPVISIDAAFGADATPLWTQRYRIYFGSLGPTEDGAWAATDGRHVSL